MIKRIIIYIIFITIIIYGVKSFINPQLLPNEKPETTEHTSSLIIDLPKTEPISIVELVLINPSFTDIETNAIREAMVNWQYATNNIVSIYTEKSLYPITKIKLNNNQKFKIIRIKPAKETDMVIMLIDGLLEGPIVGYADTLNITKQDIKTIYIVNSRIDSLEEYREVVMHENAHMAFGMYHLQDYSLMAPGEDFAANCITAKDLQYFCYLHGCDSEKLNPCDPAPACSNDIFHLF